MVYHILPEELLLQIEWATLIHLDMTVHLQCIGQKPSTKKYFTQLTLMASSCINTQNSDIHNVLLLYSALSKQTKPKSKQKTKQKKQREVDIHLLPLGCLNFPIKNHYVTLEKRHGTPQYTEFFIQATISRVV